MNNKNIQNHFFLVLHTSRLARKIQIEEKNTFLKKKNQKCTVYALEKILKN